MISYYAACLALRFQVDTWRSTTSTRLTIAHVQAETYEAAEAIVRQQLELEFPSTLGWKHEIVMMSVVTNGLGTP